MGCLAGAAYGIYKGDQLVDTYYTDENGDLQSYEYEVEVPYTWYICTEY